MALELTFGVRGKETKQALFIQESDWETSLSDVRKIIELQELHVPLEYKFLTLNGNAIAHPSETNLVLKNIAHNLNEDEQETDDVLPDLELELKREKEKPKEKPSSIPEIWVTPLKVTFSPTSRPTKEGESQEPEQDRNEERDPLLGENAETNSNGEQTFGSRDTPGQGSCRTCPFRSFTDMMRGEAIPTPKTLLKIFFCLTLMLFVGLATLMLTMHVTVKAFTGLGQDPAFHDLFSKLKGGPSETLVDLQVQFSKLEVSSKYEIDQLNTRIRELEDLYLRDLAVHKKELSLLKQQVVREGLYEEEHERDELWEVPPTRKAEKQHGKKTKGKEDRKKG